MTKCAPGEQCRIAKHQKANKRVERGDTKISGIAIKTRCKWRCSASCHSQCLHRICLLCARHMPSSRRLPTGRVSSFRKRCQFELPIRPLSGHNTPTTATHCAPRQPNTESISSTRLDPVGYVCLSNLSPCHCIESTVNQLSVYSALGLVRNDVCPRDVMRLKCLSCVFVLVALKF